MEITQKFSPEFQWMLTGPVFCITMTDLNASCWWLRYMKDGPKRVFKLRLTLHISLLPKSRSPLRGWGGREMLQVLTVWSEICLFWDLVIFCSRTSEKNGKPGKITKRVPAWIWKSAFNHLLQVLNNVQTLVVRVININIENNIFCF